MMNKTIIVISFLSILTILISGCATMFGRSEQTIAFETSTGEEAKVKIKTPDGTYTKTVPTKLTIEKSWGGVDITVVDECFSRTTAEVGSAIDNTFWLNFFNSFFFSWIDMVTAAMFEFDAVTVVDLDRKQTDECKVDDKNA